jgi:ADP-ribose pyrophosphatase
MSKINILSTRRVFDGNTFSVRVDEIQLDDGPAFTKETIEHRESIVVVPVTEDGDVLLVRQTRIATGGRSLEVPAGNTESTDASPEAAAQRELREEVGHRADRLEEIGAQWVAPGYSTEWMHVYLATGLVPDPLPMDVDEDVVVERYPLGDIPTLIKEGRIRDSMSIAVLLMAICLFGDELPEIR